VESPIINSPFVEPQCHWQIERANRRSRRLAVAAPAISTAYRNTLGAGGKTKPNKKLFSRRTRAKNSTWRWLMTYARGSKTGAKAHYSAGLAYDGASRVTHELLELWRSEERMQRLFFAQIEAAETIIFLVEANELYRKGLPEIPKDEPGLETKAAGFRAFVRYACKMATGSGKTTVMGMLAAWSILNRVSAPTNDRFSDTLLIVCPNVTIRERLQELDPALGDLSLYRTRQLVPPHRMEELRRGEVMIANWHRLAKRKPTRSMEPPRRWSRPVSRWKSSRTRARQMNRSR
jgi:type III restriction enzyme